MKRIFMACVLLLAASGVAAQSSHMARTGVYEENGRLVVADPRTTIAVDLTVQKETVLCGPYARYAQKYLGVRAPLTDKTDYAVEGASVALCDDPMASLTAGEVARPVSETSSHSRPAREFARLQPDKTSVETLPLEDAAREAANTIFSLRRHRLELITGEAGENVFGAGLGAALEEIGRLEQSYLELFLGKRIVDTHTARFVVFPEENKKQYVLCRFSPDGGILPETDLSGDMVMLRIEPSGDTGTSSYEEAKRDTKNYETFRLADPAECIVLYGSNVLAKSVLPVYEFGRTVKIALPRKR